MTVPSLQLSPFPDVWLQVFPHLLYRIYAVYVHRVAVNGPSVRRLPVALPGVLSLHVNLDDQFHDDSCVKVAPQGGISITLAKGEQRFGTLQIEPPDVVREVRGLLPQRR